jgi:hypothetical protein
MLADLFHWTGAISMRKASRRPSEYALQVWTLVARHGMSLSIAAKHLDTSAWRVERIIVGVSRRNVTRW